MKADRKRGCMYGLAIGDAMGAPVEFHKRGTFEPVTGYRSGGKFGLDAGEWTDDTAMALCLAQSIIDSMGFDPVDQMEKFLSWMEEGYMSCTGKPIGMGKIIMRTLIRYRRTRQPYTDICHEKFSGNGSLMRLAPVVVYYADDLDRAVYYAALSSKTTHASPIAVDACRFMAYVIVHLLQGASKQEIFTDAFRKGVVEYFEDAPLHESLLPVINGDFRVKCSNAIPSSGYVIHSLEAALWSFYYTDTFEEAILKAVNLGEDADTVGAITGQLAGACYGLENIPHQWIQELKQTKLIVTVLDELLK